MRPEGRRLRRSPCDLNLNSAGPYPKMATREEPTSRGGGPTGMDAISFHLDDQSLETLDWLCARCGLDRTSLVTDIVRRHLERERLIRALQDPSLAALYHQLKAEDLALAE